MTDIQILQMDVRKLTDVVPENSVDLLYSDPPYVPELMRSESGPNIYETLADVANKILKPGRLCFAYIGHRYIPEAIAGMGKHLTYVWMNGIGPMQFRNEQFLLGTKEHPGHLTVHSFHRPVLVYAKPGGPDERFEMMDFMKPGPRDKGLHDWQQDQAVTEYYIKRLTEPGDLVVDPFCGSGTTAAACNATDRRCVTTDIDPDAIFTARERLHRAITLATQW